jgi:glyoxylase-like metal-dependent hydrolase (beta-lactamase superfamily II)
VRIGDIQIDAVVDGECRGRCDRLYGAGPAPDPDDWQRYPQSLEAATGQAVMTIGAFLIRAGDRVVLNDAGLGPRSVGAFFGGGLRSSLLALGVSPEDVTDVVYSHLHVDHVGWTTVEGRPFFPRARLWVDRREWAHYTAPGFVPAGWEQHLVVPTFGSITALFAPVTDRVRLFEPDTEIIPGIRALDAAGHSPGSTVFELVSGGERGLLLGDLVHTIGELVHDWTLGFHHDDDTALAAIAHFRRRLLDERLPFAAAHFPGLRWGTLSVGGTALPRYTVW